jgi:GNAT superfamily N-acetyltransferase
VPPPQGDLIVRAIRPDDNVKSLSIHNDYAPLRIFIRRRACQYEACGVARTHVVVAREHAECAGRLWGYVTLSATEVITVDAYKPAAEWPEKWHIPAIKLARMAVDEELQGQGVGSYLVDWAIALVNDHVARHIGCRLIVVDAKKNAVGFYEKRGFTLLDTEANKARENPVMFLLLRNLAT